MEEESRWPRLDMEPATHDRYYDLPSILIISRQVSFCRNAVPRVCFAHVAQSRGSREQVVLSFSSYALYVRRVRVGPRIRRNGEGVHLPRLIG